MHVTAYRCKDKYRAWVNHCLSFGMVQCTGLCNTTNTAANQCTTALKRVCDVLTGSVPAVPGRMAETSPGGQGPTARELQDGSCASSPRLDEALRRGAGLVQVKSSVEGGH